MPLAVLASSRACSKCSPSMPEHGLAEHLDQPAVGVEGEALVAGLGGQPAHRLVVEADVEDGLHHAGHRELRPRAHRDQQRVIGLAQLLAHPHLEGGQVLADLGRQLGRLAAVAQVGLAGLGGDRETRRHRKPHVGHLGEVGALAAEQVLEVLAALGEVVDELRHRAHHRIRETEIRSPDHRRRKRLRSAGTAIWRQTPHVPAQSFSRGVTWRTWTGAPGTPPGRDAYSPTPTQVNSNVTRSPDWPSRAGTSLSANVIPDAVAPRA